MMQRRPRLVLYGVIFLLTGIGGGYLISYKSTRNPSYTPPAREMPGHGIVGNVNSDTDPFDITIEYTDEGFTVRDLTVSAGTRVRFLNTSNEEVWPASGIHPTHSLYPEKESTDCLGSSFDSCRPLQSGEFFDFTFYYVGTWTFHDHLHAYQTGSITVTERP